MVSSVDEAVGNIIKTLEATGAVSRIFCNSEQIDSRGNDNSIDNMAALALAFKQWYQLWIKQSIISFKTWVHNVQSEKTTNNRVCYIFTHKKMKLFGKYLVKPHNIRFKIPTTW